MNYLPSDIYTVVDVRTIQKVAIGTLGDNDGVYYLITGGTDPVVVYLTGDRAGRAYSIKNARSAPFLAVFDIEFEVDPTSIYKPLHVGQPAGAIHVAAGVTGISVITGRSGFDDLVTIYLDDPLDGSLTPTGGEFGFTRWRAVKRFKDQVYPILEFEAQKADR